MSILLRYIEDKVTEKDQIKIDLIKGKYLCSKSSENLRKIVSFLNKNEGMFIRNIQCDCDYKYKHVQYYQEWALEYRLIKEKIK